MMTYSTLYSKEVVPQAPESKRHQHERRQNHHIDLSMAASPSPTIIPIKAFITDHLRRVQWPEDFNPLKFKAYHGNTNPVEWLEIYQVAIISWWRTPVMAIYFIECLGPVLKECLFDSINS
jgi:hypothetical protein